MGVAALVVVGAACGNGDADGLGAEVATSAAGTTVAAVATTTSLGVETTTTVAATTTTTASTTTTSSYVPPEGPLVFDFAVLRGEANPVIADGDAADWDSRWTFAPNVMVHDGVFHVFHSGWGADSIGIGYATSPDGVTFTKVGDGPVLRLAPDDVDLEAGRGVARVLEDGTWEMFIGEWVDRKTQGNRIWHATAPDPLGPWTIDPEPIFTSPQDSWAIRIVPQAIVPGTDIVLYDGIRNYTLQIGALIGDGSGGWTAHDDPATIENQLAVHDPIFGPADGDDALWDHAAVGSPIVFATDDGYEMFYAGWRKDRTQTHADWDWLGYATSSTASPGSDSKRIRPSSSPSRTDGCGWAVSRSRASTTCISPSRPAGTVSG